MINKIINLNRMVTRIGDYIYVVTDEQRRKWPKVYNILIKDELNCLLDAGTDPEVLGTLTEPSSIVQIVASHFHVDHVCYIPRFPAAEVWAHAEEAPAVTSLDITAKYLGLDRFGREGLSMTRAWGYQELVVNHTFQGGQVFDFGHCSALTIHTPGHTPGHTCFFFPDVGALYSADIDLTPFGPWYGSPVSEIDDFIASVEKIKEFKPRIIISAHVGIVTEDIPQYLDRYLAKINDREEAILKCLTRPKTLAEVANKAIFSGKKIPARLHFEEAMIQKHLDRLLRQGAIRTNEGLYVKC